ncbi:unnamed protein product, partial [Prorocentrum cordatum]
PWLEPHPEARRPLGERRAPVGRREERGPRQSGMEDSALLGLLEEQERLAKRSLEICGMLRPHCHGERRSPRGPPGPLPSPPLRGLRAAPEFVRARSCPTGPAPSPRGAPTRPAAGRALLQEGLREPLLNAEQPGGVLGEGSLTKQRSSGSSQANNQGERGREMSKRSWNLRIFPDRDALKEELKSRLLSDSEGVTREQDLYHDGGAFADLAKSRPLETATFAMIILNTFWIGIEADYNHKQLLVDADPIFQIVENMFCAYFVFEISVRFLAFKNRKDCLGEKWFLFDAVLVWLMVWDTWVISGVHLLSQGRAMQSSNAQAFRIFRLLRLTRVARVARLLRSVPEFGILLKGVWMALRSVFSTLCLMVLIMYVYAIIFTELLDGSDHAGCFGSVFSSMNCLLLQGIFADQAQIIQDMLKQGLLYYFLIVTFLVVASMTVLNMLIGAHMLDKVRENIRGILPDLDYDGDGMISEHEFIKILESEEAVRALSSVDVDVIALVDFADYIFKGRDRLSFNEFMATVARFRGGQSVVLKDLIDVREFLSGEIKKSVKAMT